jgi:AraC-like DNA-binding protein
MWAFFEEGLSKRLADLDGDATMRERVSSVLREMLPAGQSVIEEAANRLAMSNRSLQRALAEESTRYHDVLTATRRELAQFYLISSSASLGEIAYLLGFQDDNSFIRAFHGWTGRTPGEYRARNVRNLHPRTANGG